MERNLVALTQWAETFDVVERSVDARVVWEPWLWPLATRIAAKMV